MLTLDELIEYLKLEFNDYEIHKGEYLDAPEMFPAYLLWIANSTIEMKNMYVFDYNEQTKIHFDMLISGAFAASPTTDAPPCTENVHPYLIVLKGGFFHLPKILELEEITRSITQLTQNNRICNICREESYYLKGCKCSIKMCLNCDIRLTITAVNNGEIGTRCPQCRCYFEYFPITLGMNECPKDADEATRSAYMDEIKQKMLQIIASRCSF